jgi:hypothetical protein
VITLRLTAFVMATVMATAMVLAWMAATAATATGTASTFRQMNLHALVFVGEKCKTPCPSVLGIGECNCNKGMCICPSYHLSNKKMGKK